MSTSRTPPRFAHASPPPGTEDAHVPPASRGLWLACAGLALCLLLLLFFAGRADLAAHANTRPVAERICAVLFCSLPAWQDTQAFQMLGHDVRAHPILPGVLRVQGGFRNDAPWPQAWPRLVLTLSDANGLPLAQRAFAPQEYLGEDAEPLLGAGQTVSLSFDIYEPDRSAVSFRFAFEAP